MALGAALIALLIASAPASAVETHGLQLSFDGTGATAGAFTDLGSLAIHQPTGDVFAIDRTSGVIDKFDSTGSAKNFSALGASSLNVEATCPGFQYPGSYYHGRDDIAVSSGGPTNGNIYVGTDSTNPEAPEGEGSTPEICAYDAAGNFLWRDTEFSGNGLAVDSTGHLWIGSFGAGAVQLETTGSPPEVESVIPAFGAERIAVGTNQNVFVNGYYSGRRVDHYDFAGGNFFTVQPGPTGGLAVNGLDNHLYVTIGGEFLEYNAAATSVLSRAGEDIIGNAEGIAVQESTAKVYVSDGVNQKIHVFGPVDDFAKVTTGPASNVRRTTAEASGNVDPDGAGNVTDCHVEFGLTKAYGSSAPCNGALPISTPTDVTANLTGLTGGNTYHYRLYASDAAGANRGSDQTFTTPYVSGVETDAVSNLDRTTATLNGKVDPDGLATTYYFQWGLTTGYGNTNPAGPPGDSLGSAPGNQSVSAGITGLTPNTTYHYRVVAINPTGKTIGDDKTFTSHPPIKDLSTQGPSEVGPDSAQLNGSLDPDSFDTHYYFEWGRTSSYGNTTPALPGADAGSAPGSAAVSADIGELDDYTLYHYRLVATNSFGTTVGDDVEFLSAPPFLPVVTETQTVSVTDETATVRAVVNPGFGPTVFRFQYGTDTEYRSRTALSKPIGTDGTGHEVTATISHLLPATTYHFRAVATNFSGSTGGADSTFATAAPPGVDLITASDITRTAARLHAQVSPNSSPTTYHFEYGRGSSYESSTPESAPIGSDTSGHPVAADVSGLAPGTTYHFRVVATNAYGSVSGADQIFSTAAPETTQPPPPTPCKRGFKKRKGQCVKVHKKRHKKRHQQRQAHHG